MANYTVQVDGNVTVRNYKAVENREQQETDRVPVQVLHL